MRCSCVSCTYNPLALSDDESSDVELQPTTRRSSRSSRSLADDARSLGSDGEPGPVAANGGSEVGEEDEEEDEDLEEDVYALYAFLRQGSFANADLGLSSKRSKVTWSMKMLVAESITRHHVQFLTKVQQGSLRFQVKWEGYDSKKDLTWEPEENLE